MSNTAHIGARALPARPSLEHLKKEAKGRLAAMRAVASGAQLADAQFQLAREYGFSSWRELKAEVDRQAGASGPPDPAGDWIAEAGAHNQLALHIRRDRSGALEGELDNPARGHFDIPAEGLSAEGGRLTYTVLSPSGEGLSQGLYEGVWDPKAQAWVGVYRIMGLELPLSFTRGALPPLPKIPGLDGIWDGRVGGSTGKRIVFRIQTGRHGTLVKCDSPDRGEYGHPAVSLARDGQLVTIQMQTLVVRGELDAAGERITASFVRGEQDLPLELVRRPPGAAAPRDPVPEVEMPPVEVLEGYVGTYDSDPPRMQVTLSVADGKLALRFPEAGDVPLKATSATTFVQPNLLVTLTVEPGADGRGEAVELAQGSAPRKRLLRIG